MKLPSLPTMRPHWILYTGAIATSAALALLSPGLSSAGRAAWQESPKAIIDQAWQIVDREYVDPSFNKRDWTQVRQDLLGRPYKTREQAYESLRKALGLLGDPYTRFMDPSQYKSLTDQTSGELSGVGMRLKQDEKTKALVVAEPMKGSPAIAAGILSGDELLVIDGKFTTGMTVEAAAGLIRGEVGTRVRLKLLRQGKEIELTLTRAKIEIPSIEYDLKQEGSTRVGYIQLSQFTSHAAQEMQVAIKALNAKGADVFVLDLRDNPGGLLYSSIDIARMWLNDGAIVKTVDRDNKDDNIRATRTALTDRPLAILVNKGSASSSEILTGALKDNKRAIVVGGQTFGKALVQSLHPLSDGSGLAVTIAHYYTPNGTDISKKGIKPDLEVALSKKDIEFLQRNPTGVATVKSDPQYAKAITALQSGIKGKVSLRPVK
jgi:carboxyl-terminal processing protease